MRIAMLSPAWIPIPPPGYGGIESVVHLLAEELVRRGDDVTLFATGDSTSSAELRYVFDRAPTARMHETAPDAMHVAAAYRHIAAEAEAGRPYDVVHDHTAWLGLAFASLLPTPFVHTVHGAFSDDARQFYRLFHRDASIVTISAAQQRAFPDIEYAGCVPNAVDARAFPFRAEKQDYVLCLGRITADKGQDAAVRVAKAAGVPIVLAGKVDSEGTRFFDEAILPHVDGHTVRFLGEVPDAVKRDLLAGARALLFPIRWPEPFGLVMLEAMAVGTPVIAMRNGAVPEVVVHGETGFIVDDEAGMLQALAAVGSISPGRCRREAEEAFGPERMADGYVAIYEKAIAGWRERTGE